jgi:hypothetical protein
LFKRPFKERSGVWTTVHRMVGFSKFVISVAAVSKEDSEDHNHGKLPYNGYSDEFLDRLEPNGNIPAGKGDIRYGECLVKGNDVVCSLTHGETERPPYIPVYGQFNLFWRTIAHTGLIRN